MSLQQLVLNFTAVPQNGTKDITPPFELDYSNMTAVFTDSPSTTSSNTFFSQPDEVDVKFISADVARVSWKVFQPRAVQVTLNEAGAGTGYHQPSPS